MNSNNGFTTDLSDVKPLPLPTAPLPPQIASTSARVHKQQSKKKITVAIITIVIIGAILGIVFGIQRKQTYVVVVHSHNTKELWMKEIEVSFNEAKFKFTDSNGIDRPVKVKICHKGSALERYPCEDVSVGATIWSPPNSIWVEQNFLQNQMKSFIINPEKCSATTNIPIGIAMWRDMAISLGWPNKNIGWDDILELTLDPNGWSSIEDANDIVWGKKFRYGHGHPELSNSGSLSWVSAVHKFSNISYSDRLTNESIFDYQVLKSSKALANAVVHMGKIDTDILDRMVERGEPYLHAVANYESNVIRYNKILTEMDIYDRKFAFIYPKDGTFWQTHPLCILNGPGSTWVTADDRSAAQVFVDYAVSLESQRKLCKFGIRPFSKEAYQSDCLGVEPFTEFNGVIPGVTQETVPLIINPFPETVNQVVDMWKSVRKPAKWTLALDKSLSMQYHMGTLRQAAAFFVSQMSDRDFLRIVMFSSGIYEVVAMKELFQIRENTMDEISKLTSSGETYLHDAVIDVVEDMNAIKTKDDQENLNFNYGILVMTDGVDTSGTPRSRVVDALPEGITSDELHIFSIAFGDGINVENKQFLEDISHKTNGKFFSAPASSELQRIFQLIQAEL